jgi:hypothetical protein
MDAGSRAALMVVLEHDAPAAMEQLMRDRERACMEREDLAVRGMTGRFTPNEEMCVGGLVPEAYARWSWSDAVVAALPCRTSGGM